MHRTEPIPNPAPEKKKAEGSRENVDVSAKDKPTENLPGKTDSGPEPDVFGREIPPQD